MWAACVAMLAGAVWRTAPRFEVARATTLLRGGQAGRALEGYDRVKPWTIDPAVLHVNAGQALLRLERYDEAAARFHLAAGENELAERRAAALFGLGNAHALAGRFSEAAEAYKAVLRLEPRDDDARFNLAWVLARFAPADRRPDVGPPTPEDVDVLDRLRGRLKVEAPRAQKTRSPVDDR